MISNCKKIILITNFFCTIRNLKSNELNIVITKAQRGDSYLKFRMLIYKVTLFRKLNLQRNSI